MNGPTSPCHNRHCDLYFVSSPICTPVLLILRGLLYPHHRMSLPVSLCNVPRGTIMLHCTPPRGGETTENESMCPNLSFLLKLASTFLFFSTLPVFACIWREMGGIIT